LLLVAPHIRAAEVVGAESRIARGGLRPQNSGPGRDPPPRTMSLSRAWDSGPSSSDRSPEGASTVNQVKKFGGRYDSSRRVASSTSSWS
jgi:hypothetical protein